jgi:lipopolysaccharide/colanic/teichoic acid biosynthesis glycosyltransferase
MILPSEYSRAKRPSQANDRGYLRLKRALDIALSSIGLLFLVPVFAVVAAAIKLDSRGPVFYEQERVGLNRRRRRAGNGSGNGNGHGDGDASGNGDGDGSSKETQRERRAADCYGRPFRIYKFRSMITDAEKHSGPVWAAASDSRITRIGKFLRTTRLDETPQLWNVLKGDMSLVGPRPERPTFVVSLTERLPDYPRRCEAVPGITGLAQVKWHYDTSIETANRKLQYDLYYVRNGRLLLDLKIMAATVRVMTRGEGAH